MYINVHLCTLMYTWGGSPPPPHITILLLVEKFNQLLRDMQTNGNDNGEELSVILNKLRNTEILDEESSQRLFNVMEDIYNKSVLWYKIKNCNLFCFGIL